MNNTEDYTIITKNSQYDYKNLENKILDIEHYSHSIKNKLFNMENRISYMEQEIKKLNDKNQKLQEQLNSYKKYSLSIIGFFFISFIRFLR